MTQRTKILAWHKPAADETIRGYIGKHPSWGYRKTKVLLGYYGLQARASRKLMSE